MAATVPPVNEEPGKIDPPADQDQVDSDLDAEGEEETDLYQMDQQLQDALHRACSGDVPEQNNDGKVTSSGATQSQRNGGDVDDTEPVGAVKHPDDEMESDDEDAESRTADGDADPAFEDGHEREESADSESEGEDWEAESNGHEDGEGDARSRTNCM